MIRLTVNRNDIDGLLERGIKLHGHAGPYLNLGIKMGLLALDILNAKGYFDINTEVELEYRTPISCLVDGLQISTGCTMGKGNIEVKNKPDTIRALFKTRNKGLIIKLKPQISELLDFEAESCEFLGQKILDMPDKALFDYQDMDEL